MNRWGLGLAAATLVIASGCGGGGSDGGGSAESAAPTATPEPKELGRVSSVVDLRDALVDAGYECPAWDQGNIVELAAESGSCSDGDVLSTFASQANLQDQLDTNNGMDQMMLDADLVPDPSLVGPNWIFRGADAPKYADALGGTVASPPS